MVSACKILVLLMWRKEFKDMRMRVAEGVSIVLGELM